MQPAAHVPSWWRHTAAVPPPPPPALQVGVSLLSQLTDVPEGFDHLASVPQDWVAIPDDAALFQELPYEQEDLVAAAAPAPSPQGALDEQEGSPAPAPAEEEGDAAAAEEGGGTDAPPEEEPPVDANQLE